MSPVGLVVTCLMLLFVLLPNMLLVRHLAALGLGYAVAQLGMVLVLLLVPLLVLPLRGWLFLEGLLLLLLPIELTSWFSIGEPLNYAIYSSIRATTLGESLGQLRAYLVPTVGYVVALLLYFVLLFRFAPRGVRLSVRFRVAALPVLLVVMACLPLLIARGSEEKCDWKFFIERQYHSALKGLINGTYPFDVLRHTVAYQKAQASTKRVLAQRGMPQVEGLIRTSDTVPVVGVLVIGETSRACNWQLAGYERATNPRLSQREGLYFFSDAYSGANYTILSAPMLVSPATPQDKDAWMRQPFLTEVFSQAGFRTGWITLQSTQNPWAVLSMAPCDYTHVLDYSFPNPVPLDEKLLPFVRNFLTSSKGNTMLVVHTYGGHFNYIDRYTPSYSTFTPELGRSASEYMQLNPEHRDLLVNSFDNTIVYTDMVLDSIVSYLAGLGRPAFMLYVADHGENLFDASDVGLLHASAKPTHYEAHVPYLVWLSPEYRAAFPRQDSILNSHRYLPIQTTCTYHTVLDLAGVRYRGMDPGRSLIDSTFAPMRPRMMLNPDGSLHPEPGYPKNEQRLRDSLSLVVSGYYGCQIDNDEGSGS